MPKIYLDNSLYYDAIGNSQIYAAAFLHKLIFGRCEDDMKSQLFFNDKALKIHPSEFLEVTHSLCQGYDILNRAESDQENADFERGNFLNSLRIFLKIM